MSTTLYVGTDTPALEGAGGIVGGRLAGRARLGLGIPGRLASPLPGQVFVAGFAHA